MFYKQANFALIIVMLTMIASSCGTSDEDKLKTTSTDGQFLNLNKGSSWNYSLNGSDTFTIVTASDTSKASFNKVYTLFHNLYLGSMSRSYFTYRAGNYYSLVTNTPGVFDEVVYLKDSVELGKKWQSSVFIGGNPYLHEYEVLESNLSLTVKGVVFNNVVHIKLNVFSTGYSTDSYYAPKVGLIKSIEIIGGNSFVSELRGYALN